MAVCSKCSKWMPGKKGALGDKAATRKRTDLVITWDRLAFAAKPILIHEDVVQQREQVSHSMPFL